MRIDSSTSNANAVNPYNAAAEKTASARRSCQVRKKLAKRAAGSQAWVGFDQAPVIGQWMSGEPGKTLSNQRRNTSAAGKLRN